MTRSVQLFVCFATLTGAALAQIETVQPETTGSPVAYVYVSRPTHVDGFAASSSGKLTPVPGSPFANIGLSHMSVTRRFLFGAGNNGGPECSGPDPVCSWSIYTYSIGSKGALKQVSVINPYKYTPSECYAVGPTQLDYTGTTLYNDAFNCDGDDQYVQSFKIEANGDLQFVASEDSGNVEEEGFLSPMVLVGNNKYGYETGCDGYGPGFQVIGQKRESNGALVRTGIVADQPKGKTPEDIYCAEGVLAGDPTNHLAFVLQDTNNNYAGPTVLASYTADSKGNLPTTSSYENMPASALTSVDAMSISPTGKLLAVGGAGFELFHFDGSSPIKPYTGLLHKGDQFIQFGWDSENHLYALSQNKLYVYTVTPTSIKEASGSPYSIPEASSVIVLSKP
jgi:hypothetical protein